MPFKFATRQEYNAFMNEYMKAVYRRRRRAALRKLGGRCTKCGGRKRLEFDHRDPGTKTRRVAKMWTYSEERFWAEVEKCQLLCQRCHQEKSLAERGLKRAKGVHGNYMNYQRYGCRCDLCRAAWRKQQNEWRWRTGRRKQRVCSSTRQ